MLHSKELCSAWCFIKETSNNLFTFLHLLSPKCLLASSWSVKFEPVISMAGYTAVFTAMDISCAQIEQSK